MIDTLVDLVRPGHPLAGSLLLFGIGLGFLLAGAELFVLASVRLSVRLGLPRITVGLTLVALGTSLPELGASLAAVLGKIDGGQELALGNALGSNVANIGLLLGLAALVKPLRTGPGRHGGHLLVMVGSAAAFAVLACTAGGIDRMAATAGLAVFLIYIWLLFRPRVAAYPGTRAIDAPSPPGSLPGDAVLLVLGAALVWVGSEVLVRGAADLAAQLSVSAGVIGATVVAVGTSLPELAVSFSAGRRGEGAILLGNLVGSNIANLLLVLGVVALVRPLAIGAEALVWYTPALLVFTVAMAVLVAVGRGVRRRDGLLLLVLYAVFQVILWTR
ncbi:MAG: sodium:calcium antiporter [Planctomycetes bacterium]|nr:sodium:calcium antiporter [Planctomycetota bacterium]